MVWELVWVRTVNGIVSAGRDGDANDMKWRSGHTPTLDSVAAVATLYHVQGWTMRRVFSVLYRRQRSVYDTRLGGGRRRDESGILTARHRERVMEVRATPFSVHFQSQVQAASRPASPCRAFGQDRTGLDSMPPGGPGCLAVESPIWQAEGSAEKYCWRSGGGGVVWMVPGFQGTFTCRRR
ncbi:hypothetical protein LZ30DRAFT_700085 [Colletotrichum cereale]|nr:hypothetical protein LZ30DRAFT_700085 [Colletotrichum cereale]